MNRKKQNEKVARLTRILDFLQQQRQSLATGDGDDQMLAAAVAYWEQWPSCLGSGVSLIIDAFGHANEVKDWLWRLRSAYFDVMVESVALIAREAERENLDTTGLWRGWHCLRSLLGDSRVELPLLLREENWPVSREYVLEANAVIERLGTKVDIRKTSLVGESEADWSHPDTKKAWQAYYAKKTGKVCNWKTIAEHVEFRPVTSKKVQIRREDLTKTW